MNTFRMPALFLGHGSPMNVLEENSYTQAWRTLGETLPRPKMILAISAHWYTRGTAVTAMEHPRTIHDLAGFHRRYLIYSIRLLAPLNSRRIFNNCWPLHRYGLIPVSGGWTMVAGAY